MKDRPEDYMSEGRISREQLNRKAKAEILTLKNYFSNDWFDKNYVTYILSRKEQDKHKNSKYPLRKCPSCLETWNYYQDHKQRKKVYYWDKYKNLPKEEKICPNCL